MYNSFLSHKKWGRGACVAVFCRCCCCSQRQMHSPHEGVMHATHGQKEDVMQKPLLPSFSVSESCGRTCRTTHTENATMGKKTSTLGIRTRGAERAGRGRERDSVFSLSFPDHKCCQFFLFLGNTQRRVVLVSGPGERFARNPVTGSFTHSPPHSHTHDFACLSSHGRANY